MGAGKESKWLPGPGNYESMVASFSHSYGFGKGQRSQIGGKKGDCEVPGPGYYSLPTSVGALPSYQRPK